MFDLVLEIVFDDHFWRNPRTGWIAVGVVLAVSLAVVFLLG